MPKVQTKVKTKHKTKEMLYFLDKKKNYKNDLSFFLQLIWKISRFLREVSIKKSYTIPRIQNLWKDRLAYYDRKQSFFVVYMNMKLPIWFTGSLWNNVYVAGQKNKMKRRVNLEMVNHYLEGTTPIQEDGSKPLMQNHQPKDRPSMAETFYDIRHFRENR